MLHYMSGGRINCAVTRAASSAAPPRPTKPGMGAGGGSQGKILHTRNHKSEVPSENASEDPLDNSSENPLGK